MKSILDATYNPMIMIEDYGNHMWYKTKISGIVAVVRTQNLIENLEEDLMNRLAKEIRDEIDQEILKSLRGFK